MNAVDIWSKISLLQHSYCVYWLPEAVDFCLAAHSKPYCVLNYIHLDLSDYGSSQV